MEVPDDAVWFTKAEIKDILKDWLYTYEGVRFATDIMDKSHGYYKSEVKTTG